MGGSTIAKNACSPDHKIQMVHIYNPLHSISYINNLHLIPQPSTALKHHRRIDHHSLILQHPPTPNPLPQNRLDPIKHHPSQIPPQPQIPKVPHKPSRTSTQTTLQRFLARIPDDTLAAAFQPALEVAASSVDVAEDVQQGFDAGDFGGEVFAAEGGGEVKAMFGWCVGDEDVCFGGDGALPGVLTAIVGESKCWVWKGSLRAAVDVQGAVVGGEVDCFGAVLEVCQGVPMYGGVLVFFGQGGTGGFVEICVVVAGYDVFVLVREGGEEIDSGLQLGGCAMGGYVAGMYEDIAIGDVAWIERMGIGYTDYADGGLVAIGCRTKQGEEMVAQAEDKMQRLRQEGVYEMWTVEW